MLNKVNKYGFTDVSCKWFESYLSNRKQVVCNNGVMSDTMSVNIGAPQGSILGPILFLIYINDISQHVLNGACNLYADDVVIYVHGTNVEEVNSKLQQCIDTVNDWYLKNKLTINTSKSNVMVISSRPKTDHKLSLSILVGNNKLPQVTHVKYLGIIIDNNLPWHVHIEHLCKKVNRLLGLFTRLSKCLPFELMKKLYMSLIQPS